MIQTRLGGRNGWLQPRDVAYWAVPGLRPLWRVGNVLVRLVRYYAAVAGCGVTTVAKGTGTAMREAGGSCEATQRWWTAHNVPLGRWVLVKARLVPIGTRIRKVEIAHDRVGTPPKQTQGFRWMDIECLNGHPRPSQGHNKHVQSKGSHHRRVEWPVNLRPM